MLSRNEFLEQKASEWYHFVKGKPKFQKAFMANKVKLLFHHLRNWLSKNTITHARCRQLVLSMEASKNADEKKMQEEVVGIGQVGGEKGPGRLGTSDREGFNEVEMIGAQGLNKEVTEEGMKAQENDKEDMETNEGNKEAMEEDFENREDNLRNSPKEQDTIKRVDKEWAVKLLTSKSDEYLFESKPELEEKIQLMGICPLKNSWELKERRESYGRNFCDPRTDLDLFKEGAEVNRHVKETAIFKKRGKSACADFVKHNMEGLSPDRVLVALSHTVKELKIDGKTKTEMSDQKVLHSLQETVDKLKQSNSKQGKDQMRLLAAGACSLENGVPSLDLSWRIEMEAKEMKKQLMSGENEILTLPKKNEREGYPPEVKQVAHRHWIQITVTEPGKHQRLLRVVKDGDETVPTQYQTTTNEEAYASFKETCQEEVGKIMKNHAKSYKESIMKRPESKEKQHKIKYAEEKLGNKFPCLNWFLDQRPQQVRMMDDHSTGRCKVSFPLSPKMYCSLHCSSARPLASTMVPWFRQSSASVSARRSSAPAGPAAVLSLIQRRWRSAPAHPVPVSSA